eukprot:g4326.t1
MNMIILFWMSLVCMCCEWRSAGAKRLDYTGYSFDSFVSEFEREYVRDSAEWRRRETIFEKHLQFIERQNENYKNNASTWWAGVNEFADWSEEEMSQLRGYTPPSPEMLQGEEAEFFGDLPPSIDWRSKGVVTAVKQQGGCGGCWSFSSVQAVESALAISTGKLLTLSPQNLISCVRNPDQCGGKGGCEGATAELGLAYVKEHGLSTEEDYPYAGKDASCKQTTAAATINGTVKVKSNDARQLMLALVQHGPVAISAAAKMWNFYSGGVFDSSPLEKHCDFDIDHAVQLVGYGYDDSLKKAYWTVRNSWGAKFGEGGYIRLLREPLNETRCGVDPTPSHGICGKGASCTCPPSPTYCGTCGLLSDSWFPTGARLTSFT